jgi:hypothetical protein
MEGDACCMEHRNELDEPNDTVDNQTSEAERELRFEYV